jgi:hypothetical protein
MATSEKSGKPKKVGRPKGTKSKPKTSAKKSGSKKGGNFLGAVGDLVAPAGWGSFATAAALVGIDQADAAFRRKKSGKSSAKKGGMKDGTHTTNLRKKYPYTLLPLYGPDEEAKEILNKNEEFLRELFNRYSRIPLESRIENEEVNIDTMLEQEKNKREALLKRVSDSNIQRRLKRSIIRIQQQLDKTPKRHARIFMDVQRLRNKDSHNTIINLNYKK